jgi:hypothetical protein
MLPTHERAHTHVRTRSRKVTYSSKQVGHSRQSILGGGCPCRLSSGEHVRRAPFLTVLGTHRISRSLPHPSQRMPASPAAAPVAAGPAPPASTAQSNNTRARSMLCGRHAPSHAGHGNTLGASCCRTCRRLCAKYALQPRAA